MCEEKSGRAIKRKISEVSGSDSKEDDKSVAKIKKELHKEEEEEDLSFLDVVKVKLFCLAVQREEKRLLYGEDNEIVKMLDKESDFQRQVLAVKNIHNFEFSEAQKEMIKNKARQIASHHRGPSMLEYNPFWQYTKCLSLILLCARETENLCKPSTSSGKKIQSVEDKVDPDKKKHC